MRGESHGTHHAQRVVAEGHVRVARSDDAQRLQVVQPTEGVDQFAVSPIVQAERKGIDGEVASVLIVLQRAVLDDRFAAVAAVRLAACPDEFDLTVAHFHLCRAEVLEHGEVCPPSQPPRHGLCQLDATADGHHVDILRGSPKDQVAHIATDHIRLQPQPVGLLPDHREGLPGQCLRNIFFVIHHLSVFFKGRQR